MEYQMRNWYYYCWLSGDHIVEQAVHGIDTMAWAMGDKLADPAAGASAAASRAPTPSTATSRTTSRSSTSIPNNVRGYHHCRHWVNTPNQVKDYILGTKGTADVFGNAITGENKWRYRPGQRGNRRQAQTCTRSSTTRCSPRSAPASRSTTASRPPAAPCWRSWAAMAAYTGEVITPDQVLNSKLDLSPAKYEFGPNPVPPVPVPGTTKFA